MPQVYGITRRNQPSMSAEAAQQQVRVGARGDQYVIPLTQGSYGLADEGAYFKATNATVSTGIIHALTTSFSATAALFVLRNTDSEGAKRLYLDYVKLMCIGTAPTATTSIDLAVKTDVINRYSSGGTAITPVNVNQDSSQATIAALNFGAITAAAESAARLICRNKFPARAAPALVSGDMIFYDFGVQGGSPQVATVGAAAPATAQAMMYVPLGPVIIGGGDSIVFHQFYPAAATTAPTFEFEIAWWER